MTKKKDDAITQPIALTSYTFFHEGKEYIIEARDQSEARTLFNQLINNL